jgi:major membrane immunogen (membrane-anchored lipoprotein)
VHKCATQVGLITKQKLVSKKYIHYMKKLLTLLFILPVLFSFAQIPSPKQFLGYELGDRYTPHYRIVSYFKAVAAAAPSMVKLEKYGETYEGRELMLAYISSEGNIQNLDNIRNANLQAAGLQPGSSTNDKAIVWLSYNVHGNEPSSSEAAMATLFALVDPSNAQAKEWLKNTVVIIDPCLNPDGRDRYVNWFTSVAGKNENPDPQSREHAEPWPGGRSNHYNFDLNRDWAWQTQIETQQRMVKYNQWMPHVHVDFHEQYYNNPYYFAPAAEPFHEVITPWQREFQTTIGKNNAALFDKNAWLYFTRESFDLFYPSYGDTYPTYNGAIGMTYEQGGHSAGGLAVTTNSGDTLTLADRIMHHFTTGLSTVEVTSRNAAKVVSEFKKFFDESSAAKFSTYKTYVITSDNIEKIQGLTELLNRNGIGYSYTTAPVNATGYNYFNGKTEAVKTSGHTLVISAYQPKSALIKVLMEPVNKLTDSVTYDITAWSIPYAYGLQAYASNQKINVTGQQMMNIAATARNSTYGYLVPYNSVESAKTLAALLKKGVKVRVTEKAITYKGVAYGEGSLLVLRTSNQAIWNSMKVAEAIPATAVVLETGFMEKGPDFGSANVRIVKAPKIAMLTGQDVSSISAGEVWHFMDQTLDYPVSLLNAADIGRLSLSDYDVLIMPAGNYKALNDKSASEKLKDFVRSGGKIVAIGNTVYQMSENDWSIKAKEEKKDDKDKDKNEYAYLKRYADRERDETVNSIPGAIYRVQLDESHPLAFGFPAFYYTLKLDTDVYEFLKDGWNVGVIKKEDYVTGFTGSKVKSRLKDGLLFGVQPMGRGSVVYLADDPLFRMFWQNGKLLFANAIFMVD